MRVRYRPIANDWPGERTPWAARKRGQFKSGSLYGTEGLIRPGRQVPWNETLLLLDRELGALGATEVVFQIDLRERDIRLDGLPRGDASPSDPAVIISFDSRYGALRYFSDRFDKWQDNVRAIALGLEALRKVERYGITRRGEQYLGWQALPAAGETGAWAREFILGFADPGVKDLGVAYRAAAKQLHPDTGGSREEWDRLQRAKEAVGL